MPSLTPPAPLPAGRGEQSQTKTRPSGSKILVATDAWHPMVNGVVRTLDATIRTLRSVGHAVELIEPGEHPNVPVPFYRDVSLSLPQTGRIAQRIRRFNPQHVHIATEGPLGLAVRQFCRHRRWRFTTSYHTRFPEYLRTWLGIPPRWTYRYLRWFHSASSNLMTATPSLAADLHRRGFTAPLVPWSRGVDTNLFRPRPRTDTGWPRPVLLSVGRVSAEKNLEAFLSLPVAGTKVVVGDGPARARLQAKYPTAKFLGFRTGEALAACYAAADVFVFPSRTDTFGLVLIEALACGVPVAAYPVMGPIDIITKESLGCCDPDLGVAVAKALASCDRTACTREGERYTWAACTRQFEANLVGIEMGVNASATHSTHSTVKR